MTLVTYVNVTGKPMVTDGHQILFQSEWFNLRHAFRSKKLPKTVAFLSEKSYPVTLRRHMLRGTKGCASMASTAQLMVVFWVKIPEILVVENAPIF